MSSIVGDDENSSFRMKKLEFWEFVAVGIDVGIDGGKKEEAEIEDDGKLVPVSDMHGSNRSVDGVIDGNNDGKGGRDEGGDGIVGIWGSSGIGTDDGCLIGCICWKYNNSSISWWVDRQSFVIVVINTFLCCIFQTLHIIKWQKKKKRKI